MPLGLYAKHEAAILQQAPGCADDITKTKAFQLLRDDPDSKLIINCGYLVSPHSHLLMTSSSRRMIKHRESHPLYANHAFQNAGNVAQGWRTESYRSITDGSTSNIHILAIDYRGYGLSTGFPTEEGVIIDGIAAVDWAMRVAKVPSGRIVILGQSLGTAVTSAVAEHYALKGVEFAGVVVVAAFTDLPNLLTGYSIAGYVPILSPLRRYPSLQKLFISRVIDKWPSAIRLANFVRASKRLRLFIIHARDDYEIPCHHSDALFIATANATTDGGMDVALIEKMKARNTVDMGDGAFISTWKAGGNKIIREEMVAFGGESSKFLLILDFFSITQSIKSLKISATFPISGRSNEVNG